MSDLTQSGALALPDPKSVDLAQAAGLAKQIETWAAATSDLDALADTQAKLQAIEAYLRKRNDQAAKQIARADRRLEVRIGELLRPAPSGPKSAGQEATVHGQTPPTIPRQRASEFRKMAAHADEPAVEQAIEAGESRAEVLRRADPKPAPPKRTEPAKVADASGDPADLAAVVSRVLARYTHIKPSPEDHAQYKAITRTLVDWVNGSAPKQAPKSTPKKAPKPAPAKKCDHIWPKGAGIVRCERGCGESKLGGSK